MKRDLADDEEVPARLEAIDTTGFSEQEKLNKALMVHDLRDDIEDVELKEWEMPVNQISGIHLDARAAAVAPPFATARTTTTTSRGCAQFPKQIDDTIANMRKGMRDQLMPPKFLLEKVVDRPRRSPRRIRTRRPSPSR